MVVTDGSASMSVLYASVADSPGCVRFSYRMPAGLWIAVTAAAPSDFTPYSVSLFKTGGRVFTKKTSEWIEGTRSDV